MKRTFLFGIMLFLLTMGSGCATCINGTSQKIPVKSNPAGATLTIVGDKTEYSTPCEIELKRKTDHILHLKKDGYEPATVEIKHVLSGAVAGNILAGGLIGWGVDAATGSQYRLIPETVSVDLKPKPEVEDVQPKQVDKPKTLLEELNELDQLKASGKITKREYETLRHRIIEKY